MRKEKDVLVLEKSINPGFIFLILVVLLLVGGSIYYYHTFFNNPEYIVKSSIKKFAEKNNQEKKIDLTKPIKLHGGIEFDFKAIDDEEQKTYDVFNNIEFLYNIDTDLKNKVLSAKINSKYESNSLLNAKLYYGQNNAYLYLDDFYNKYINFNNKNNKLLDSEKYKSISSNDLKIIADGFMKVLTSAFTEEDFYRENTQITYNDAKIDVYKNYVVYNKDNFKKVNERVLKSINTNKEFTNILKKIIGDDVYKNYLNKLVNLKDIGKFNAEFIIYTKGYNNEFIKMELNLYNDADYMIIEVDNNDIISLSLAGNKFDSKINLSKNAANNYVINLSLIEEDVNNMNAKINVILENIKSIENIDDKNVISYDKLSKDEINKIKEKFNKNKTIKKFVDDFKNFIKNY